MCSNGQIKHPTYSSQQFIVSLILTDWTRTFSYSSHLVCEPKITLHEFNPFNEVNGWNHGTKLLAPPSLQCILDFTDTVKDGLAGLPVS